MKSTIAIATLLSTILSAPAFSQQKAQDETVVQDWLVLQMGAGGRPLDLAAAETRIRTLFMRLSTQVAASQNSVPRQRGQFIGRMLGNDLDNDGAVTSVELREALEPQARRPLVAGSGVSVVPTDEQVESIIQQLLAKELAADKNGDGTIDAAEIREHADAVTRQSPRQRNRLNLADPAVVKALDTSGDKIVSEEELLVGVRQAFAAADANKDGQITREEALPRIIPRFDGTF